MITAKQSCDGVELTAGADATRELVRQVCLAARNNESRPARAGVEPIPWAILKEIGEAAFDLEYGDLDPVERRQVEKNLAARLGEFCAEMPPLVLHLLSVAARQVRDQIDTALPRVRESFRKSLLDTASKAGEPIDAATGEVIPGVDIAEGSRYVSIRFTPGGRDAVAAAWAAGELDGYAPGPRALTDGSAA
jgi:hypothetical protein